jgi:hypothetical protein
MILYVNGDSHAAGAEAVNPYAFAEDDQRYFYLGRAPHPDNLSNSWGKLLSSALRAGFHCGAESASSNTRIIRTTKEWIENHKNNIEEMVFIIQWSTWEREEWLYNGTYYQVGSSGIDDVPQDLQEKYRHFVIGTDWRFKTEQAHKEIWNFHEELTKQGIKHIFFNGNNDFSKISTNNQCNWGNNYIGPYDPKQTFDSVIRAQGIDTVAPNSWHFGKDGHSFFYRFMLQYIINNKFI